MFIKNLFSYIRMVKESNANVIAKGDVITAEEQERMNLLHDMLGYIKSGNWTRASSRQKYVDWLKSKFDNKFICSKYGTDSACFSVFLNRQNHRIEAILEEPYNLLRSNNIREAYVCFYQKTGTISLQAELSYNCLELLPEGSDKDSYLLCECREEIEIIKNLLKSSVKSEISFADQSKLAYIIFLLGSNDPQYSLEKRQLFDVLYQSDNP